MSKRAKLRADKRKQKESKFYEDDPGPSRRTMRNLVRWQTWKQTGSFSGNPRASSGYTIQMVKGNHTIEIDAVHQATPVQFTHWFEHAYTMRIPIGSDLSLKGRLELLKRNTKKMP